jgi:ABC-type transport system involved in cytochrome bd biosynthesis fused ATPase/permease subunit
MAKKSKKTIIMVAHRQAAVEASDMVISLFDGCATVELQKQS